MERSHGVGDFRQSADRKAQEAHQYMERGAAPQFVLRAPFGHCNRPKLAYDTKWWRAASNKLRELWLLTAAPFWWPQLPVQPPRVARLRTQLQGMANSADSKWQQHITDAAERCYGGEQDRNELTDLHWQALEKLDKLHKRDWRKKFAVFARRASTRSAEGLHRVTKTRAEWTQDVRATRGHTPKGCCRQCSARYGTLSGEHTSQSRRTQTGQQLNKWAGWTNWR